MGKIYSSDREICLFTEKDSSASPILKNLPDSFRDELKGLFDRNGLFIRRKLKESAQSQEELYAALSRSDYRELRYLGLAGLMTLGKESYDALFWDAFYDSFYPVRALIVQFLENRERSRLFNEIFKKLTGDPRQVVREKAYGRIKTDFADLFSFRISSFSPEEQYRLIMFLDSHTAQDYASLTEFIDGPDRDLAARALYRIQQENRGNLNRWPERTRELNLLRVSSLPLFCHGGQDSFAPAFELIDEHTPPGLASQYITELTKRPFKAAWAPFYARAARLIGRMKGPVSRILLEQFYKNRDVWQKAGKDMAAAFTTDNQYYTAELLSRILGEGGENRSVPGLAEAASRYSFPLN